jgi:hypothetical protein
MDISRTMLRDHLRGVTAGYFAHHDLAPADVADFAPFAANVRRSAERHGDLRWLKLGLAHVLAHPEQSCENLNGGSYAFGDSDMYDLIEVVWEALWPNESPVDHVAAAQVALVEMSSAAWDALKSAAT